MDYNLDNNLANKIRFSKEMIDYVIAKYMSNNSNSKIFNVNKSIEFLNGMFGIIPKKGDYSKESKYITSCIEKLNKQKVVYETMDAMVDKNMDALVTVDPKNLTKLNKEALAVLLGSMIGNQQNMITMMNQMKEEINKLNAKVDELQSGISKKDEVVLEAPEAPVFVQPQESQSIDKEQVVEEVAAVNKEVIPEQMPGFIPKGSLHDLKNNGLLPVSDDAKLIDYCINVLGMDVTDMNFVPNKSQLDSLMSSGFVSSAHIRKDISKQHKGVAKKYDDLISSYQKMIDDMQGNPLFDKEIDSLEQLIDKIGKKRDEYLGVVSSFDEMNMEQYFQFGASRFESKLGEKAIEQQSELAAIDDSLRQLNDRKNSLEKAEYKHLFARIKNKRDLKKVTAKIEKLKTKQGKIQTSQKKVIDTYTSKYVQLMEKEFDKFIKEQEQAQIDIQKKNERLLDLNEKQKIADKISKKMVKTSEKKKQSNKFVQIGLNAQSKVMGTHQKLLQDRIHDLQNKVGTVDLSQQHSASFGYAL